MYKSFPCIKAWFLALPPTLNPIKPLLINVLNAKVFPAMVIPAPGATKDTAIAKAKVGAILPKLLPNSYTLSNLDFLSVSILIIKLLYSCSDSIVLAYSKSISLVSLLYIFFKKSFATSSPCSA